MLTRSVARGGSPTYAMIASSARANMIRLNTTIAASAWAVDGLARAISVRAARYPAPGRFSSMPAARAIATDPRDRARIAMLGLFAWFGVGCLRRSGFV